MKQESDLLKIENALKIAREVAERFTPGDIEALKKSGGDPVTEADIAIDKVLKETLVGKGDGWLSEETVDEPERLQKRRVWIVDPLDGTKEFVQGIDEWCISIALVEDGKLKAGGICNPVRDEVFLASVETGLTLNGEPAGPTQIETLDNATVLASRSEVKRGQWQQFDAAPFKVIPMGSVAYKLARVAAGLDDITFTLVPKNEWDIAAGVVLLESAGGKTIEKNGQKLTFNQPSTLKTGMIAAGPDSFAPLCDYLRGEINLR